MIAYIDTFDFDFIEALKGVDALKGVMQKKSACKFLCIVYIIL